MNTNYVGRYWDRENKIVLRQSHWFCGRIGHPLHPLREGISVKAWIVPVNLNHLQTTKRTLILKILVSDQERESKLRTS
jgi:hypothetical protein